MRKLPLLCLTMMTRNKSRQVPCLNNRLRERADVTEKKYWTDGFTCLTTQWHELDQHEWQMRPRVPTNIILVFWAWVSWFYSFRDEVSMDQCSFCALHKGILLKVSSFIQQRYFFWRVSRVSNNSWSSEKALKHQVKVYCHPCIRPSKTQASAVMGTHPQDLGIPTPCMVPTPKYPVLIMDYVASPTADHKTNLLCEQQWGEPEFAHCW